MSLEASLFHPFNEYLTVQPFVRPWARNKVHKGLFNRKPSSKRIVRSKLHLHLQDKPLESKGMDFIKAMEFQAVRSTRPNSVTQGYKFIKDRKFVHSL